MATMTVRSTYALDGATSKAIKLLAQRWDISQAEVIRRSVKLASEQAAAEVIPMTPADVIAHYRRHPPSRSWAQTKVLIAAQRKQRHEEDAKRSDRQWGEK